MGGGGGGGGCADGVEAEMEERAKSTMSPCQ